MKFTASKEVLVNATNWVARGLPRKAAMPVLNNYKLEVTGTELSMKSTNLSDITMESTDLVTVAKEGSVLVLGKSFTDVVRVMPDGEIVVELIDNKLSIASGGNSKGKVEYFLSIAQDVDFPETAQTTEKIGEVDTKKFEQAVFQVAIAAAKEETTPILTTIKVEFFKDSIVLSAIDRYRIAKKELPWKSEAGFEEQERLIKAKSLLELVKGFEDEETIGIYRNANENKVGFLTPNKKAITLEVAGEFPKTDQLFDQTYTARVVVNKGVLLDAINRTSLATQVAPALDFNISPGHMNLSAGSDTEFSAKEAIEAIYDGDEKDIRFNSSYIKEGVSQIDEGYIVLELEDSSTPARIFGIDKPDGKENEDYKYIIVPIRNT